MRHAWAFVGAFEPNLRLPEGLKKGKNPLYCFQYTGSEADEMARDTTNTVTGVARRICRSRDDVQRVAEQIRYWTREGLLRPEGERHSGTGRWRTYHEREICKAAILHELSRRGLTIGAMGLVMAAFRANQWEAARVEGAVNYIDMALDGERVVWVELFEPGDRGPAGRDDDMLIRWDVGSLPPDTARWALRLNLTRILDGVRG